MTSTTSYNTPREPCVKCGGRHYLTQCKDLKALRVKDRLAFIQSKRLCVNCFKPGHLGRDCSRHFVCAVNGCGQRHSKFLHRPSKRTQDSEATRQGDGAVPQFPAQPSASVSSNFVAGSKDKVALPIVAVWVKGRGLTYALIDPGGTSGYCSEELAKKLGVPRKSYTCDLPLIHQGNTPVTADFVNLQVSNVNGRPQFDRKTLSVWNESVKLVDQHYTMDIPFKDPPGCQTTVPWPNVDYTSLARDYRETRTCQKGTLQMCMSSSIEGMLSR